MVYASAGLDNAAMSKMVVSRFKPPKARYFFREWRKHRGFSQEELAEMIGVTPPSISQLERGIQGFSDRTLEALADALHCSPGDLLMRNPLDTSAPWSIWDRIREDRRPQALKVLETFADNDEAA